MSASLEKAQSLSHSPNGSFVEGHLLVPMMPLRAVELQTPPPKQSCHICPLALLKLHHCWIVSCSFPLLWEARGFRSGLRSPAGDFWDFWWRFIGSHVVAGPDRCSWMTAGHQYLCTSNASSTQTERLDRVEGQTEISVRKKRQTVKVRSVILLHYHHGPPAVYSVCALRQNTPVYTVLAP